MRKKSFKQTLFLVIKRTLFRGKIAGIYYLRKRESKKHCFILCDPRSGSNLLLSYLNSNPNAYFGGEILCPTQAVSVRLRFISKKTVFRHMHHFVNHQDYPVSGAKIFFSHLESRGITLKELDQEFPEAKWLILYRGNILDQYLSMHLLLKTGCIIQFKNMKHEKPEPIQIETPIPKTRWRAHCEQIRNRYKDVLKIPGMRDKSLWVSYDELVNAPQTLFDEAIFPFLNLPRNLVQTDMVKQNIWKYPEIIANYNEVKDFIEQTDSTHSYERHPNEPKP